MNKEEYDKKYWEVLESKGNIIPVNGVFSSRKPDLAHIEEQKVDYRGKVTKYIGCHAWSKVITDRELHNDCTALKGSYMELLSFVMRHKILIPFLWLFRKDVLRTAYKMYHKRLHITLPKDTHLSPIGREVLRVGKDLNPYKDKPKHWFNSLVMVFVTFIDTSQTYYIRFQDFISLLGAIKNPIVALYICELREKNPNTELWRIKKIIRWLMKVPKFRKLINKVIEEIDYEACQPDDDDLYFAYRQETYDTRGLSWEERQEWFIKADKTNKNFILNGMS